MEFTMAMKKTCGTLRAALSNRFKKRKDKDFGTSQSEVRRVLISVKLISAALRDFRLKRHASHFPY
jgi:hypothetical protein